MPKRSTSSSYTTIKKTRMDELNDFWDDELDGDAIEDCFKRASQVFQKEKDEPIKDVSLLSSYSIFKEPDCIFTSTQRIQAGVSNNENRRDIIRKAEEKYVQKEGEVSVLRANLEHLRSTFNMDQKKTQLEWKEKLSVIEKENKTVKSELEFKNLEIVNLKQQLAEVSKFIAVEQKITQKTQIFDNKLFATNSPEQHVTTIFGGGPRIYINVEKYCPLKSCNFSFQRKDFNLINTTCWLQDQSKEKQFKNDTEDDINNILQKLLSIIDLSTEDLNSDEYVLDLHMVLCLSLQMLKNFYDYLKLIELKMPLQGPEEVYLGYLQRNSDTRITEKSFACGEILIFLEKILLFSAHLKKCLLLGQIIDIGKISVSETFSGLSNYVILLSHITCTIGRIKREKDCHVFLCAVFKMLGRILNIEEFDCVKHNVVEEILKQFLCLNFHSELIYEINIFVNTVTRNPDFIYFLCPVVKNLEDKPNKDFCRLCAFITLLQDTLMKNQNQTLFVSISRNILNFTYNVFRSNNVWLHQQENKTCECLRKLCKLTLGIIYKNLEMSVDSNKDVFKGFVKILNLLGSNLYDLTQKYITDLANFKEIVHKLTHAINGMEHANLRKLEELSTTEEFPEVPRERFIAINI